jgi:hypothetical protein
MPIGKSTFKQTRQVLDDAGKPTAKFAVTVEVPSDFRESVKHSLQDHMASDLEELADVVEGANGQLRLFQPYSAVSADNQQG